MHVLTLTSLFPNARQPHLAVFVRARMEAFTQKYGHKWTVVAPVPYFPKLPVKVGGRYGTLARVPSFEEPRGYPVYHPRYLVTPKVGMRYYGRSMAVGVRRLIHELHAKEPFDIIDGHYVYPDGTAAVRMGEELRIPVVLSARGTDLSLYPRIPSIASRIRTNLQACQRLICVCNDLKQAAIALGTPESKISVIGNGVDGDRFRRGDGVAARRRLGLPAEATIIVSVGHLTELKGFHLLIEACGRLNRDDVILVIAGDGPERAALERLATSQGLEGRVRFAGAVRNEDLPAYYRSADLFALASSREGWPNVLCEAQACGLPAVATKVGGIPEVIRDEKLGVLVEERSAEGLRAGLETGLSTVWDRHHIEAVGHSRTWNCAAHELEDVFNGMVSDASRSANAGSGGDGP